MSYYGFRPYVSVAERQRNAQREVAKLAKKGLVPQPIHIEGRTIARSFWGQAWCDNLESYMDYANRLPRGRTYARNGSVVHLEIKPGEIQALVSGSELYKVKISITPVVTAKWKALCSECAGGIGSLVELLQGRLSERVMAIITRRETGLFPSPREFKMTCSCPDWAGMCKHIAAVCYGIGARLDTQPELLFVLRSANHEELITQAAKASEFTAKAAGTSELSEQDMSSVFGIELDSGAEQSPSVRGSTQYPVQNGPASALQETPATPQPAPVSRRKKPAVRKAAKPVRKRPSSARKGKRPSKKST
jgi:uncharacterized Zn finger protein